LPKVLVTNDDSYLSKGLYLLYDSVKGLGEARIYSTLWPRSAVGHSVSFNKPLRLDKITFEDHEVNVVDGSPVDALHLAIAAHGFEPDLVVSGVNVGENLTIQHIVYSGTIAVAMEAALMGIPALAFSADVRLWEEFKNEKISKTVRTVAETLARSILKEGMPENVDFISINFPSPDTLKPCIRMTRAARRRWRPAFEMRLDTRGRPYYWLHPLPINPEKGSDVYAVCVEGCVSVTPLKVDLNTRVGRESLKILESVLHEVEDILKRALVESHEEK